jgi:hypothetical protein
MRYSLVISLSRGDETMKKWATLIAVLVTSAAWAESPYAKWENGPSKAEDYFPIAVWVQQPRNAEKYKAIGINLYEGLSGRLDEARLAELEKAGMPLVVHYRPEFKDRKIIVGWMHGDEPDNAQARPKGQKGYGPPILPEKIVGDYQKLKEADPTRPVFLNLGQGVAYDNYIGRGVRRGKMEDYPQYVKGGDVVSFDIYPVVHETPAITGNLWYVAQGVTRLGEWTNHQKPVWNCVETTHISNVNAKATPAQVKAEVWMSIIHGSRGLIYFAHEFKPKFVEAGLLADEEMAKGVAATNAEVKSLAAVINAPEEASPVATVNTEDAEAPVAVMGRRYRGATYVFAVGMRAKGTGAAFEVAGVKDGKAEVIGEGRTAEVVGGRFKDAFEGYGVHLYRISSGTEK